MKKVFLSADKLFVALFPVFMIALVIGFLCGLGFLFMGIATYFDWIDPGPDFRSISPWAIAGGGAAISLGAVMGVVQFRRKRAEANARIKSAG